MCLVDCHGKAEPDWELLPLEFEWEHVVVGGEKRYLSKKHPSPSVLPLHDLRIDGVPLKSRPQVSCRYITR